MTYVLKSMRKTVPQADLFGSARDEEFFREMMDAEICSTAARTQSIGIAQMLYRQLARDEGSAMDADNTRQEGPGRKP